MTKKDIFIDTNKVKCFSNPLNLEYKRLLIWLKESNDDNNKAYLVGVIKSESSAQEEMEERFSQ